MEILSLILYPIVLILGYSFEIISFPLKDYPLLAIVLFAIIIGFLLKPLQKPLIEIEKKTTQKIKIIDEEYKKLSVNLNNEEKFLLKERLYKEYSFSPFQSFFQAISFFVLIPFLISVILVFEESLLIKNGNIYGLVLNSPDGLLFGLNLLPMIMFLGTLIDSIFRYKNDRSSQNRFLFISIVLFFIVYNMSSALIIFWITMNLINSALHFYNTNEN